MLGISCSSFFYTYVFCYFVCISGINHLKSIINGAFLFFLCSYRNFVKASSVCWVEIFQYWFCIVFYTKAWSMMCEKVRNFGIYGSVEKNLQGTTP